MTAPFDKRLTPARPDLAADYLRGSQERGDVYVSGKVEEHVGGGVDIGLLWTLTERNFIILTGQ